MQLNFVAPQPNGSIVIPFAERTYIERASNAYGKSREPSFKSIPSENTLVEDRKIPDKTSLNFQLDPIFRALNFHIRGRALFASSCMLHAPRRSQRAGRASYQACIRRVTHSTRHKENSYISTNVKNFQTPCGSDAMARHGSIPLKNFNEMFPPSYSRKSFPPFPNRNSPTNRKLLQTQLLPSKSHVRPRGLKRERERERYASFELENNDSRSSSRSIDRPSISRAGFITRCHELKKFFHPVYIFHRISRR